MKNERFAELWAESSRQEKLDLLTRARDTLVVLNDEMLDADRAEFDALAAEVGMKPIWVTYVDAAGMRDRAAGAVNASVADKYPARNVAPAQNA